MDDLVICRCGLAMYAIESEDGSWTYVCEECDGLVWSGQSAR